MAPIVRILTAAALVSAALAMPSSRAAADADPTGCGGVVFRDLDADGSRVEGLEHDGRYDDVESGAPGVPVRVVDATGRSLATITNRTGRWAVALSADRFPIRIEFEVPADHAVGRPGPDAGHAVQFAASPDDCDGRPVGNLGVFPVDSFCASNPKIAVPCLVPADAPSYAEQPAIRAVSNDAVDDRDMNESTIDDWLAPEARTLATQGQIGSVYGQSALRDGTVFAAAFTKRHTRLVSELNPAGNPTVIYRIPLGGRPEVLATLDRTAADPHGRGGEQDLDVMDAVFTTGIGDIEISPDESILFVVDLGRRELVELDTADGAMLARHPLDGRSLGRSDCGVTNRDRFGDLRAFGLGWRADELLLGVVCSAESTVVDGRPVRETIDELGPGPGGGDHGQLTGYVYGFRDGEFAERLAWPLAADRGQTHGNELVSNDAAWHPWVDAYPFDAEHVAVSYPQPAITDLVVDAAGDLVVALGDRWGHQTAPDTVAPAWDGATRVVGETIVAGDLQHACRRGRGWVIEGSIGCDGGFGYGWEFFDGDNVGWYAETALGSVARLPGRAEVVVTQMNPVIHDETWRSGGLTWHGTTAGDRHKGVRLYDERSDESIPTFENASGLGDLVVLCGGPPPSIGGSVWRDLDADGIRAPGDGPVVGAAIELLDADGRVVSVDYSDDDGVYGFDEGNVPGGLTPGADYSLSLGERNYRAGRGVLVGTGKFTGLRPTARDAGDRDDLDSDGRHVAIGPDGFPGAVIAVRAGDDPATVVTEDPIAHHYDFGLRERYDLAVTTSPGPRMRSAGIAEFRIEIHNQGSLPSGAFEVVANLPPETSLQASSVATMMPTSIDADTVSWAFGEDDSLAPGGIRTIDMQLRVNDPTLASITSSVAIVADSGIDEDSDPGLLWSEDDEDEVSVELFGLAGTVWTDVGDGDAAGAERSVDGVVVHVLAEDGTRVGGTTTDAAGRFLFDSFPAGSYRIAIPASEFDAGRPLRGYDRAVGAWSNNVGRMLGREGYVTTEPIELGAAGGSPAGSVRLGLVKPPPTPLVDVIVPTVLVPLVLLFVGLLAVDRRRNLGASLRTAGRT